MLYWEKTRLTAQGAKESRLGTRWTAWLRAQGLPYRYDERCHWILTGVLSVFICWMCALILPESLPYLCRSPLLLLLNWLPVLLVLVAVAGAVRNVFGAAAITLAVCGVLNFANELKIEARDDPVSPQDLTMAREALTAAGSYDLHVDKGVVASFVIAFVLLLAGAALLRPRRAQGAEAVRKAAVRRAASFVGSLAALAGLTVTVYASSAVLSALPCTNRFHMTTLCQETGFHYTFLHLVTQNHLQKPDGFSKSATEDAIAATDTEPAQAKPVNVIFVMSEAFSDVTDDDAFAWTGNNDPLLHFHALAQSGNAITGHLIVPNYGGGTANTEFDVLTGMQTAMLSDASVSAFRVMHKATGSVFRVAEENGWQTAFIHPGKAWFYNRQNTYRWLGAQEIIFEDAFTQATYKGGYVSDASLTNYVISDFEQRLEQGAPQFTYVTTIQNHMAYTPQKYEQEGTLPALELAEELPEDAASMLQVYSYGVRDADTMLGRLVYYFERRKEPVLLVWFGDHMPSLGQDYLCYQALGRDMTADRSSEAWLDAYAPPFLLWANDAAAEMLDFDTLAERLGLPENGKLSASFLGAAVLDAVGCGQSDAFFAFVNELRRDLPVVQRGTVVDAQDGYLSEPDGDAAQAIQEYQDRIYYRMKYETAEDTASQSETAESQP